MQNKNQTISSNTIFYVNRQFLIDKIKKVG